MINWMIITQEIGLRSLTYIKRGAVRIQNNPLLCYANNIEWTAIAENTTPSEHYISGNKKANECPVCPDGKRQESGSTISNVTEVSVGPELNCTTLSIDSKKRVCWNRQHCQKICPASCGNRTCTESGACCDESCVSGCSLRPGTDKLDVCDSCRYLRLPSANNTVDCVQTCPDGFYNYNDFRCVTAVECRNLTLPFSIKSTELIRSPFIPYQKYCQTECPEGHIKVVDEQTKQRQCKQCDGVCRKDCETGTIDSISTAQKFRGCNRILGNLLIQIRNQGGREFVENRGCAVSEKNRNLINFDFLSFFKYSSERCA